MDAEQILSVSIQLAEVIVEPSRWPSLMEELCRAADATGALLLNAQTRFADLPVTASIAEVLNRYYKEGWHERDVRARAVPLQWRGQTIVSDEDIVSRDEVRRSSYYNELLIPHGVPWFASIGVRNGDELWGGLSLLRSSRQGPFSREERVILSGLSARLAEVASLSSAIGYASLVGILDALKLIAQPALALDRFGRVLDANATMEALFDQAFHVRSRRLVLRDKAATAAFERFLAFMRVASDGDALPIDAIFTLQSERSLLTFKAVPVSGPARVPFLGARAILIASNLSSSRELADGVLKQHFRLTQAEDRLARHLARGASLRQAASAIGIAPDTARNHLKAIFAKTNTHRQSELVALLGRL